MQALRCSFGLRLVNFRGLLQARCVVLDSWRFGWHASVSGAPEQKRGIKARRHFNSDEVKSRELSVRTSNHSAITTVYKHRNGPCTSSPHCMATRTHMTGVVLLYTCKGHHTVHMIDAGSEHINLLCRLQGTQTRAGLGKVQSQAAAAAGQAAQRELHTRRRSSRPPQSQTRPSWQVSRAAAVPQWNAREGSQ
jgi:hypothetical protein